MSLPLVSIIIPVYNVESYLPQCLDSIISQTYKSLEIIVINDGSTDSCGTLLTSYAQQDSRIQIIEQKNQGLSEARNTGLSKVKGNYICFVDSDDWLDTDTIEIAVKKAEESHSDIVLWNYIKEYGSRSEKVNCIREEKLYTEEDIHLLYQRIVGPIGEQLKYPQYIDSLSTAWGKLYKSDVILNHDLRFVSTKEIGTEDLLFTVQAFQHIRRAYLLPNPFNHYRKTNYTSLTVSYKPLLFKQWTKLQDSIHQIICSDKQLVEAFHNRIALSTIGLGLNECLSRDNLNKKRKKINSIITSQRYKQAYQQLDFSYLPFHWKLFFQCAKHGHSFLLLCLLTSIQIIINKK